jgi:pSer/pThr/pTyr-binding forkhead associated (FHA) protein
VSRRHARIVVAGGQATLEDLGSKNGTFLRGKRLTSPAVLSDGDEILLGRVPMTFRVLTPVSTRTGAGR